MISDTNAISDIRDDQFILKEIQETFLTLVDARYALSLVISALTYFERIFLLNCLRTQ